MNLITTFKEKKQQKQVKFEQRIIREISLEKLKNRIQHYFSPYFKSSSIYQVAIEDVCIDFSVESYLLGAAFSKFGYQGESEREVSQRCRVEIKEMIDSLYDYLIYWSQPKGMDHFTEEVLYLSCEGFIGECWSDGFEKGLKRYRLKLH